MKCNIEESGIRSQDNFEEKRKTQRFNIPLGLKCRFAGRNKTWKTLKLKDISGGGIGLSSNQRLSEKSQMEVLISAPDLPRPIEATCTVVWQKKEEQGKFRAGLKFEKIRNYEEFISLICDRMLKLSLVDS